MVRMQLWLTLLVAAVSLNASLIADEVEEKRKRISLNEAIIRGKDGGIEIKCKVVPAIDGRSHSIIALNPDEIVFGLNATYGDRGVQLRFYISELIDYWGRVREKSLWFSSHKTIYMPDCRMTPIEIQEKFEDEYYRNVKQAHEAKAYTANRADLKATQAAESNQASKINHV